MKTVLEWYNQLPDDIREKALKNYNQEYIDLYSGCHCQNIAAAIVWGFWWRGTEEGQEYWLDIHEKALNGEFDKVTQ